MDKTDKELIRHAIETTRKIREVAELRPDWKLMGCVGSALVTINGNLFTGVNINLQCGMGTCAEFSAVTDMIKHGESEIATIVAVTFEETILPPCGRCREMLYQINEKNLKTEVIVSANEKRCLAGLLPLNWQETFDKSLY